MTETMASNLSTLPVEILTQIASYLCPHCIGSRRITVHSKHLSHLSRTCRRLRDILQPILFHFYCHSSETTTRLAKFLYSLSRRPDLAQSVAYLEFREPGRPQGEYPPNDETLAETSVASLGFPPPPEEWLDVDAERRNPFMELVIAHCSNVETLVFPTNREWVVDLLPAFASASPPIIFPRLRRLEIIHYYISGDNWTIHFSHVSPLLEAAPNLESLEMPTLEGFYANWDSRMPALGNLKNLNLGQSAPTPYFLTCLLAAAAPRLETFNLSWIRADGYGDRPETWSVMDVWLALEQAQQCLRTITLEITEEIPLRVDPDASTPTSVSLSGFVHLESLKVDGRVLQGIYQLWRRKNTYESQEEFIAQLFPPSLREVTLWEPDRALITVMTSLARQGARGVYPSLRTVLVGTSSDVGARWMAMPDWLRKEAVLRGEFARAGIDFRVV